MKIALNNKNICIGWIFFFLILFSTEALAQSVTVRVYPDESGNDTTLNKALEAINNYTRVDTIVLVGNEKDTFTMSYGINNVSGDMPSITFKSEKTDPDSFPVLNHTGSGYYELFRQKDIHFERLTITASLQFEAQGQLQTRIYSFANCVIKDCTGDYFVVFKDKHNSEIRIENCLFVNNSLSTGLIHMEFWNENSSRTDVFITNSTFDENNIVFDSPNSFYVGNLILKNCIFSNNSSIFPSNSNGATLKSHTTYSITDESTTGYGDSCTTVTDPKFTVSDPAYRENPSDWRITALSPAKNYGTPTGAPSTDIGNNIRRMAPDAGCWETLNHAPADIIISNDTIDENLAIGTVAGILSTEDNDLDGETFVYELVDGVEDNESFVIKDDTLFTEETFDFETKSGYTVKISTTDIGGLSVEKTITINIRDINEQPDSLNLSNNEITENITLPAFIGILSTEDPDTGDSFTYDFVSGFDEDKFDISNDTLFASEVFDYESDSLYTFKISSTDQGGLTLEKEFDIKIIDEPEAPYLLTLSNDTILTGSIAGTGIGVFDASDPEQNIDSYELISGDGDDDNGSFVITDDTLKNKVILKYDTAKTSYSIRVRVTDTDNLYMDSIFTITVVSPPLIVTEPLDTLIIGEGSEFDFSVYAVGTEVIQYQWYRNDQIITGENNATVSDKSVSVSYDSSVFYCEIQNGYGTVTTSQGFLRVLAIPKITADLEDTTEVILCGKLSLSVETSGEKTSFTWVKDGKDTVGTDSIFNIDSVSVEHSGSSYKCIVRNIAGYNESNETFLKVIIPPSISVPPLPDTAKDGETLRIFVTADGTKPLVYKWFQDGEEIGENSSALVFISSLSDSGTKVFCQISNKADTIFSDTVEITVNSAEPEIISQPESVEVSEGDSAIFFVKATGTPPLFYSWFKKGVDDTLGKFDTLILKNLSVDDSGSGFYCVVSNAVDNTYSDTVTLSVEKLPPEIITHPKDTIVYEGERAVLCVSASGSKPLQFFWYKEGNDSTVIDSTDSLIIPETSKSDSCSYYCIVKNVLGQQVSDTAEIVVLDSLTLPVILEQPLSQRKFIGDSVSFSVSVYANPSPMFRWERDGELIQDENDSILKLENLIFEDDSSHFVCIASNSLGEVLSDTAVLEIIPPPSAAFNANPRAGTSPLNVNFTNNSIGDEFTSSWNFGDETSQEQDPSHTFETEGMHTIKLVVSNPSGKDSITDSVFVYSEGDNPIVMSVRYLHQTEVVITLKNLDQIDTALIPPPSVDSVGIWYLKDSIPISLSGSLKLKNYSIGEIMNDSGIFFDTLNIPGNIDETYGLNTGLHYNTGEVSQFSLFNGSLVFLNDTTAPDIGIDISGSHLTDDSATISFHDISSLDTMKIDSIGFCYALDSSQISFISGSNRWFSVQKVIEDSSDDMFSFVIHDDVLNGLEKKIWIGVVLKSKNGKMSSVVSSSFITLEEPSDNPVILNASALSSGSIRLNWNSITNIDPQITHIRIWYGQNSIPSDVKISDGYDTIRVSSSTTSYDLPRLNYSTTYFFAAQVYKNDAWSDFTDSSRAQAETLEPSGDVIPNTAVIKKPVFDTMSTEIKISWCIDEFDGSDLDLGISYSTERIPDLEMDITQIVSVNDSCQDTVLEINGSILFNTKYYIALWLKTVDGKWASPTKLSTDSITTPDFTREIVELFDKSVEKDTVYAFNKTVQLWKDITFQVHPVTDTIASFEPDDYDSMIHIGTGISFLKKESVPPFFIGLRYSELPEGYSETDLCLYRDSSGILLAEHGTVIDSVNNIAYVKTSDLSFPFILMIDKLKPEINIIGNTDTLKIGEDFRDTVLIKDNIANVLWTYVYCRGEEAPGKNFHTDTLRSISDTAFLSISSDENVINPDNSLRAYLIVSDGANKDTVNVSKRVYREKSDGVTTSEKEWFPISVTAKLENSTPEFVISQIMKTDSSAYDKRYLRMYRWYPNPQNKSSDDKWVEYSQANSSIFDFSPGKLIWVKTRENIYFDFGSAVTLSLKENVTIELPPENWTDFALPYKFNTRLADILDSTKNGKKLQIYTWETDHKTERYKTHGFYLPDFGDNNSVNSILEHENDKCYSVFNPLDDTITLNIPPIPVAMSQQRNLSKTKTDHSWRITIRSKTEKEGLLPDVCCGYVPGTSNPYYAAPPSFSKARVKVYNKERNRTFGHYMQRETDDGLTHEIAFTNNSSEPLKISYSLNTSGSFPSNYKALIYNSAANKWESQGTITVDANSSDYRWLVASDDSFRDNFQISIQNFKYSLCAAYPNPFRNIAYIRYTVPVGAKEKLRFTIFDVLGRRVWNKLIHTTSGAGMHTLRWDAKDSYNKPVKSGIYFVQLSILNENRITKQFKSKLTYLP